MRMKKIILFYFFFAVFASIGYSQETILEGVIETGKLHAALPQSFQFSSENRTFTLVPASKDMDRFEVQWSDGTTWNLRFGEEISVMDGQGELLITTIEQKKFLALGSQLLNRQTTAHGIVFLDQDQKKVFSATRYAEGLFPATIDIWVKNWLNGTMPESVAVLAVAELLRQTYFFEG